MGAISLIDRGASTALPGWQALLDALARRDIDADVIADLRPDDALSVVAGPVSDESVAALLRNSGAAYTDRPEGAISWQCEASPGREVVVLAGTDRRGMMYSLFEAADAVLDAGLDGLREIGCRVEYPRAAVRGLDRFIMGPLDDEWFLSDDFWRYYLQRLAHCRFNRFVLVTGFDTAYFSPPYPFLVEVPGYESVQVAGLDRHRRERNLHQLSNIGRMCHEHGLEFIFGTWQQTPWTKAQDMLVQNLPEAEGELAHYCAAGLRAFLAQCTELDGIHFRVNLEAGVGDRNTNETFWKECIDAVAQTRMDLQLDLRAKGLTDGMIEYAQQTGLSVRVPTKYWCEHAGLPYHLTQMRDEELTQLDNLNHSRRYSYSDLLRKPRPVDLIYRLWNQGSATIFAWGDPDYASRFVNSCALGSSASFEIAAPLSMKGGHAVAHREPWRLHADPELQSDSWEDERYWFWYLVFGRLGYSAAVDPAVWRREFDRRFGRTATPHVERAFTSASRVLPLITAFHMPKHPMLHYWPEMSTGAALFAENNIETSFRDVSYSHAEPSDPGLFYSIVNYVADLTTDSVRGKYTPLQVAAWLADLSAQITAALERCEQIGQLNDNREFQAARRDFLMLADLASYHSHKARAAVELELSSPAGRAEHLPAAHRHMTHARDVWHSLAVRGGETYCANLEFGAGSSTARRGNWSERQVEIDADIAQLERTMADADIAVGSGNGSKDAIQRAPVFHPSLECDLPDRHSPHADLRVELRSTEEDAPVDVCMHFRHPNQLEGRFQQLPMTGTGNTFHATIPASYITDEWDLLIYFSCLCSNEPALFPGINNPQHPLPYFIVDVGD